MSSAQIPLQQIDSSGAVSNDHFGKSDAVKPVKTSNSTTTTSSSNGIMKMKKRIQMNASELPEKLKKRLRNPKSPLVRFCSSLRLRMFLILVAKSILLLVLIVSLLLLVLLPISSKMSKDLAKNANSRGMKSLFEEFQFNLMINQQLSGDRVAFETMESVLNGSLDGESAWIDYLKRMARYE